MCCDRQLLPDVWHLGVLEALYHDGHSNENTLTLNCCLFPVSAHSVLTDLLLPLQLFGTPFIWPFAVLSLLSFRRQLKNFFLQPSFPAFLTPHPTQRLRFGGPLADIVRFANLLTYLLT